MAYDEHLAARIRALLGDEADLTEKKMFGDLAFLIGGNMAVAASGRAACWCAPTRRPPTACSVDGRRADGDARPADAGLAARRRRSRPHEAPARAVGTGGRGLRQDVATEAVASASCAGAAPISAPVGPEVRAEYSPCSSRQRASHFPFGSASSTPSKQPPYLRWRGARFLRTLRTTAGRSPYRRRRQDLNLRETD